MELTFLGKTSFKFKTKNLTLLIDPISDKERADVVVLTTPGGIGQIAGAVNREKPFLIDRPGEYELGGVGIIVDRLVVGKPEMIVRVSGDGVEVAHTGTATGDLEEKMIQRLAESDVMLVTLAKAVELVKSCEPYIAVLMGYENLEQVDQFLGAHKFEIVKRDLDKLKLEAESLPENTEVVVLNG